MSDAYADKLLEMMIAQGQAQFGDAMKGFWFHGSERCPACGGEIDEMEVKGERALSLNGFMYRKRGILIGYFLCGKCAGEIFAASQRAPMQQTPLHEIIEMNLGAAYEHYLNSMDA